MCKCGCKGRCTLEDVFRVILWLLTVCVSGVYPLYRDDGVPFSQSSRVGDARRAAWGKARRKMRAVSGWFFKKADWCWLKGACGLCDWRGEGADKRCCFKCGACPSGPLSFRDPSMSAAWRPTMTSHEHWVTQSIGTGAFVSIMFQWPGVTLASVCFKCEMVKIAKSVGHTVSHPSVLEKYRL